MKLISVLCVAIFALAWPIRAGEITTDQLGEAFLTYCQKAEKTTLNEAQMAAAREELATAKADPMLRPCTFGGERVDRELLMEGIAKGIQAWRSADRPLPKIAQFASDKENLKTLSDAELVIAFRLVEQGASKVKPEN